jgi:hypothetical protein
MDQENVVFMPIGIIFLHNADYRPKTNAVILLDMGHILRVEHAQEK